MKSWGVLTTVDLNKSRKRSMRGQSPNHGSDQRWTWEPSPIINLMCLEKEFHPLQIFFHKPTPCDPLTTSVFQPFHASAYFTVITHLESCSFSTPNLHNHFPRRAWLQVSLRYVMPTYVILQSTVLLLGATCFLFTTPDSSVSQFILVFCCRQSFPSTWFGWIRFQPITC